MTATAAQLETRLRQEPSTFRKMLKIDADGEAVRLSDVMDDWQRKDFEALDEGARGAIGVGPVLRRFFYLERPRGHSKSSDIAVLVLWMLFAAKRQIHVIVAAADREQARVIRNHIDKLLRLNPWLSDFIEIQNYRILNPATGSVVDIMSSDAQGAYGRTPDIVVIDELTHWKSRDLWDSLFSSAAKKAHCCLVVISNAGVVGSWQWKIREAVREDADWYFHSLDGPQASWITDDRLEAQKRLLPTLVYERLWLNRWTETSGDALTLESIDRAVGASPITGPAPGYAFVGGLDLGVKHDHSALVAVGKHIGWTETRTKEPDAVHPTIAAARDVGFMPTPEAEVETIRHEATGKIRLALCRSWKPGKSGVDLRDVERATLEAHARYRFGAVLFDPSQAHLMAQRLKAQGVPMVECPPTGGFHTEAASLLLATFQEHQVELYNDPELIDQLKRLRITEKSYGFRLDIDRDAKRGHGDKATAFVLALLGTRNLTKPRYHTLERPLLTATMDYETPSDAEALDDVSSLFSTRDSVWQLLKQSDLPNSTFASGSTVYL